MAYTSTRVIKAGYYVVVDNIKKQKAAKDAGLANDYYRDLCYAREERGVGIPFRKAKLAGDGFWVVRMIVPVSLGITHQSTYDFVDAIYHESELIYPEWKVGDKSEALIDVYQDLINRAFTPEEISILDREECLNLPEMGDSAKYRKPENALMRWLSGDERGQSLLEDAPLR